jgi:tRNA(Ile)-lysidine synthase
MSGDQLAQALLKRCTFPGPQTEVTCAVSGGADSTALLLLALAARCAVRVVHVDHGVRPESAADARWVGELCDRLGVACEVVTLAVPAGPNLEARLREARRAALPTGALTGHTADDQAETILLNVLRGAGLTGLAGMRAESHPLLSIRRHETVSLCAAFAIVPRFDVTNTDLRFRRNAVRAELMPMIERLAERDMVEVLVRQAELIRDDDELLDLLSSSIDPSDCSALKQAPVALARRAIRAWLGGEHPPSAAAVERVLDVARGRVTAAEVGGGLRVERHAGRLSQVFPNGGLNQRGFVPIDTE